MTRKILFLINPISGTANKNAVREQIIRRCEKEKLCFEIHPTNKEGKYDWLKNKISQEQFTDIIGCGGDGSISQISSSLIGADVNVGIVPMGSGNGLAYAAKISANITKALDVIVRGKAEYIDGFTINGHFSCMLCGLGFDAQVAHDFAHKHKRGLFTYIKVSARNFFKDKCYPFQININGVIVKGNFFFISIANSNQFGNHFTIAPQADLSDGLVDIIAVKKMHKFRMMFTILKHLKFGRVVPVDDPNDKSDILYFKAAEFTISNPGKAPFHMDGEPKETPDVLKVRVIRNAIRLLQPVVSK
jgi:YegS/Rv2252/BmrU family lipid kinase